MFIHIQIQGLIWQTGQAPWNRNHSGGLISQRGQDLSNLLNIQLMVDRSNIHPRQNEDMIKGHPIAINHQDTASILSVDKENTLLTAGKWLCTEKYSFHDTTFTGGSRGFPKVWGSIYNLLRNICLLYESLDSFQAWTLSNSRTLQNFCRWGWTSCLKLLWACLRARAPGLAPNN